MLSSEHVRDPDTLTLAEIEDVEKQSLRMLFQAVLDFYFDAFDIFYQSADQVKDVAEDITREMLDRLGGYHIGQRILGNVDYRKARYVILPDLLVRQALFVDSKAEKEYRTATMQMSQTSLQIRQRRGGLETAESGKLPVTALYRQHPYLTTTMLAHYQYHDDAEGRHILERVSLAAVPNGRLQNLYNPSADETIWLAGRNAPTLGEDFRVRLSFDALAAKRSWRVQRLVFDATLRQVEAVWRE